MPRRRSSPWAIAGVCSLALHLGFGVVALLLGEHPVSIERTSMSQGEQALGSVGSNVAGLRPPVAVTFRGSRMEPEARQPASGLENAHANGGSGPQPTKEPSRRFAVNASADSTNARVSVAATSRLPADHVPERGPTASAPKTGEGTVVGEVAPALEAEAEQTTRLGEHAPGSRSTVGAGSLSSVAAQGPAGSGSGMEPRTGGSPGVDASPLSRALAASARRCYPRAARRFHLRGTVTVSFCVDDRGGPGEVSLVASAGSPLLDRAAVECVVPGAAPLPPPHGCYRLPVRFTAE